MVSGQRLERLQKSVSTATGGIFGVGVMLAFAGVGYLMTILGYSVVTLVIAFSLRARFEAFLSQN